ncbi:hypothetical protein [Ignavibacterium album]|uniref:hypothetical protein n=1 Tax=Ignavibacterium album TaxID=591197 RepID=UPI0038B28A30
MKLYKILKKVSIILISTFIFLVMIIFVIGRFFTTVYSSSSGFSGESYSVYCGIVFEYNLSTDIGYHHNQFGYISMLNDKYVFNNLPFLASTKKFFPKEYYKIFWGDREYLIEEKIIYLFCNYINSGFANSKGNHEFNFTQPFLVSHNDSNEEPTGIPIMPEEYKHMIFEEPIVAEVVEKFPETVSFKINKGQNDDLFLGCEFFDNKAHGLFYEIIEMNDSTSILQDVMFYQRNVSHESIEDSDRADFMNIYNSLKIGEQVTTKFVEN